MHLIKAIIRKSQMTFDFGKHEEERTVHATTRHMQSGAVAHVKEHQRRTMVATPSQKREQAAAAKNFEVFAVRQERAREDFAEALQNMAGITKEQADRVTQYYLDKKLATMDSVNGTIRAKHGAYLDKEVILNAVKLTEQPEKQKVGATKDPLKIQQMHEDRKQQQAEMQDERVKRLLERYNTEPDRNYAEEMYGESLRKYGAHPEQKPQYTPEASAQKTSAVIIHESFNEHISPEAQRIIKDEVEKMHSIYGVPLTLHAYSTQSETGGTATAGYGEINFAKHKTNAKDEAALRRTVRHEYGHILEHQLVDAKGYYASTGISDADPKLVSMWREYKKGKDGFISMYSTTNWKEGGAEAIAHYHSGGKHPYAEAVHNYYLQRYKGVPEASTQKPYLPVFEKPVRKPRGNPNKPPAPEHHIAKVDDPDGGHGHFVIFDKDRKVVEIPNEHGEIEAAWPRLIDATRALDRHKGVTHKQVKVARGEYDMHKSIAHPVSLIKSRKLHGRINFQGLDISIETGRSRVRQWHNPHDNTSGMSRMSLPYGYIKGTEGTDGDHVDVFVGADHSSDMVYVVHTMKAPDFTEYDEDKCFVGLNSPEEAKRYFDASYSDPRFFGSMSVWTMAEFKEALKTLRGKKLLAKPEVNISRLCGGTNYAEDICPICGSTEIMGTRGFTGDRRCKQCGQWWHYLDGKAKLGQASEMYQLFREKIAKSGEAICKQIGDRIGVNWKEIDLDEFCDGMFHEEEHRDVTGGSAEKTAKIVLAHLKEDPKYYSKLKAAGL